LLQGKGAECQLDGAYLIDGEDHVDHHTLVEHRAAHCRSAQTYRGIVSGKGTAVFDGIVVVHRDAQKTEAHQENRNLLLSETATVHTKPHLEIDADDVVCSHGATVGSLDEDQLFYLRARGVPEELAHSMLTYAFLKSIVDRVSDEPTRVRMREALLTRIPHGDDIREVT
jgi:Fe-S cluster assembly protein SufD